MKKTVILLAVLMMFGNASAFAQAKWNVSPTGPTIDTGATNDEIVQGLKTVMKRLAAEVVQAGKKQVPQPVTTSGSGYIPPAPTNSTQSEKQKHKKQSKSTSNKISTNGRINNPGTGNQSK